MFAYIYSLASQELMETIELYKSDWWAEDIEKVLKYLSFFNSKLHDECVIILTKIYKHFDSIKNEQVQYCEDMSNSEYFMWINDL